MLGDGGRAGDVSSTSTSIGFEAAAAVTVSVSDSTQDAKRGFRPLFFVVVVVVVVAPPVPGPPAVVAPLLLLLLSSSFPRTGTAFMGRAMSRTEEKARMGGRSRGSSGRD